MSAGRRDYLLGLLAAHDDDIFGRLKAICDLCVSEMVVSGARVRVFGGVSANGGGTLLYSTDKLGHRLDDLASTAGTAPSLEAFELGRPILVPDLASERIRWPGFTADAATAGIGAIFSFPLQLGAARLGVLESHRHVPGPLSRAQLTDAFLLADAATVAILDDLRGTSPMTSPGLIDIQTEVHQATGFVAVDLQMSLPEALARIRGHAFAHQLTLTEVAKNILEHRLRLENGE